MSQINDLGENAKDRDDDTIGAGETPGADSFGPTDTSTPEGESDSAFGGETGEFGSGEEPTTDANTSAGDTGDANENG